MIFTIFIYFAQFVYYLLYEFIIFPLWSIDIWEIVSDKLIAFNAGGLDPFYNFLSLLDSIVDVTLIFYLFGASIIMDIAFLSFRFVYRILVAVRILKS